MDSSLEGQHKRAAQILVPVKVRIGIAGSAAIGAAALITSQANYNSLSKAERKKDLFCSQSATAYLEKQVDSLAEMVSENKRGLELLLLKPGDLCAALGKSCCFYANHSGVVKNTLQELKLSLFKRQEKKIP